MIEFKTGDLFADGAEAVVNPVNCVGIMGRGLALAFKTAFPDNFADYARACAAGEVVPGRMFVHVRADDEAPRIIVNFPTKRHWRGKSRLEDVVAGLDDLVAVVARHRIASIAVPALGAGLGGLPWPKVRPLIAAALGDLDGVRVSVYEPHPGPGTEDR